MREYKALLYLENWIPALQYVNPRWRTRFTSRNPMRHDTLHSKWFFCVAMFQNRQKGERFYMRDSARQYQPCVAMKVVDGYFCKKQLRLCHLRGLKPMRTERFTVRLKLFLLTEGAGIACQRISVTFIHQGNPYEGKCHCGKQWWNCPNKGSVSKMTWGLFCFVGTVPHL